MMNRRAEILHLLRLEIVQLTQALRAMERLEPGPDGELLVNRRGRKFMPAEERQRVSERMKRYWAERRQQL